MYAYEWDSSTGGYILTPMPLAFSKEPRPVYYKELDILGFDKYWDYDKNDSFPYMWAEANNYYYRGRLVAKTKGGSLYTPPELVLIEDPEPEGAIVKKDGKIKEFEDACAAVLSESRIELKKSEALNYLADVNMITRRSYKDLDTAMRKATQIRNRKE